MRFDRDVLEARIKSLEIAVTDLVEEFAAEVADEAEATEDLRRLAREEFGDLAEKAEGVRRLLEDLVRLDSLRAVVGEDRVQEAAIGMAFEAAGPVALLAALDREAFERAVRIGARAAESYGGDPEEVAGAIIEAAFGGREHDGVEEREAGREERCEAVTCEMCGGEVPEGARFCPRCGARLGGR